MILLEWFPLLADGSFAGGLGAGIGAGIAAGIGAGIASGSGAARKKVQRQLEKAIEDGEISIRDKDGTALTAESLFERLHQHSKKA